MVNTSRVFTGILSKMIGLDNALFRSAVFRHLLGSAIWLLYASVAFSVQPQKILITVGEIKTIQLPNALKVHVTRKGIILLVHDHDDFWTLTALRTGMVAVEAKLIAAEPQILYVDVRPRPDPVKPPRLKAALPPPVIAEPCLQPIDGSQFEMHAVIELLDDTRLETTGVDSNLKLQLTGGQFVDGLNLLAEPHKSTANRHIIGDPVLTTRACEDIIIRAGGEDEFEIKTDDGHVVSTWKSHGLDIKMKIFPVDGDKLRIPFSVSLRTPSKGRGSYGLSDITSSIDVMVGKKILAAVLNLTSTSNSQKETLWLADVPLIGPLFKQHDESKSASKLLLWFEILQRSEDMARP
jgi:hypothetical protein